MAEWTKTAAEYDHVRKIALEMPLLGLGVPTNLVTVTLRNGTTIQGIPVGTTTNADYAVGAPVPVVEGMSCEVRLRRDDGQLIAIDALDIESYGPARPS